MNLPTGGALTQTALLLRTSQYNNNPANSMEKTFYLSVLIKKIFTTPFLHLHWTQRPKFILNKWATEAQGWISKKWLCPHWRIVKSFPPTERLTDSFVFRLTHAPDFKWTSFIHRWHMYLPLQQQQERQTVQQSCFHYTDGGRNQVKHNKWTEAETDNELWKCGNTSKVLHVCIDRLPKMSKCSRKIHHKRPKTFICSSWGYCQS